MKNKLLLNFLTPFASSKLEGKTFRNLLALVMVVVGMNGVMGQNTSNFNDGYITVFKNASISGSTGSAIVLEEYLPSASSASSPNFSVNLPYTAAPGSTGIVAGGTTSSNGAISRSENGRYILVPGWSTNTTISTAAIGVANTANLICAVRPVNGTGTIGTGITGTSNWFTSSNDYRGATSDDGTNYWVTGGSLGVRYTNNGTTLVTLPSGTTSSYTNSRTVNIFNGNLYYSTGSTVPSVGIYQIGSGKPITASQTATMLVAPTPYSFSISPDGLTIYAVNSNLIVRYTYNGTSWSSASAGLSLANASGLVVDWTDYTFSVSGTNGALIYASNTPSSGNSTIVRANDNGTSAMTGTIIASVAVTGNIFKQIAFSPIKQTISKGGSTPAAGNITKGSSNTVLFQLNLSADEGNSTVKKIVLATAGTAVLGTDISNFRILNDANNDGIADANEISSGFTTTGTISGSNIIFSGLSLGSYITQGSSKNFLIIGNVAAGATAGRTFIPSIASNSTINSIDYTSNITNAGGSLVTMGTSTNAPTGNTLTIVATSNNWIGANGNWNTAGNWSLATVPSSSDNITISSGSPVLDVDFTLPAGKTLTLSGTGGLTINPGKILTIAGTADFGGNVVTFKSDATGTAMLGILTGTLTNATNVKVERYIPAKRAFRFLSPSVTTSTSIKLNWQENAGTTAGLGTHITGVDGTNNGFDATSTNNPSLFTFNNSTGVWEAVTSTLTNSLTAGIPYRLMVRGDRLIDLSTNTPTATETVLRATGTLKTGNFSPTLNQAAEGISFVGNPYQATVNIKTVLDAATNMNTGVVYYWDPTLNARGGYVTRDLTNNNNTPTSSFNQYLQPGQAVFVKKANTAPTATMTFTENHKSLANAAAGVFRNANISDYGLLRVNLQANTNNQWQTIEGTLALFNDNYSWNVTSEDATKMANLDEEVSFVQNNTNLAIALQNNPSATSELPIKIDKMRHTNYQWQFDLDNYNGATPYLFDTLNNSYTQINNGTLVPFTADANTTNRFKIVFQNAVLSHTAFQNTVAIYPNPAKAGASFYVEGISEATVTVSNLLGQNIPVETKNQGNTLQVTPNTSLSKGVYLVSITTQGITKQVKWIVE